MLKKKINEVGAVAWTILVCTFFPYKKDLHIMYVSASQPSFIISRSVTILKTRSVK